ncbi:hypothetical protein MTO96_002328 [Rhipicephalus appendiculatus]
MLKNVIVQSEGEGLSSKRSRWRWPSRLWTSTLTASICGTITQTSSRGSWKPFVRELELSKLGGPAKRSLRDDHSEVVNKLKMEPIVEPFFVQGYGLPPVAEKGSKHTVESKKVVIGPDSGSDHKVEMEKVVMEPDSGSDHKAEGKKVVTGPDSGSDHKVEVKKGGYRA